VTILLGVALVAVAIVRRDRIYARVADDAPWHAALWGGLAAAVAGAVANDSTAVVWVMGVIVLGVVTAYLAAPPRPRTAPSSRPPPTLRPWSTKPSPPR
jgi:peptidoglycan/LPS O-acetylase OafA/YrhL